MYKSIDPILDAWAKSRKLVWTRKYQDYEVRSIFFTGFNSLNPQIWIEKPYEDEENIWIINISINNFDHSQNISASLNATSATVDKVLDEAYNLLQEFIRDRSN